MVAAAVGEAVSFPYSRLDVTRLRVPMKIMRLALCSAVLVMQAYAETPHEFAVRFYQSYFRWQIRGVPSLAERNRISPFFSSEILRLYTIADRQRTEFERRFPFDPKHPEHALKPPWSKEGDPFSDVWEGISTFAVGRVIPVRGRVGVQAYLEYIEDGKAHPWTDTLVLERAGNEWVVADILFARGGALVADMREGITDTDRDLRETRK